MHGSGSVIDDRRTFLRHHVRRELGRTDDVLAVQELIDKLQARFGVSPDDARVRELLSSQAFFYRVLPDQRLWLPLLIVPAATLDRQPAIVPENWSRLRMPGELAPIIKQFDEDGDWRGIVLVARSGAGKTVLCRKVFLDCFCAPLHEPGQEPALAGHLPCWVTIRAQTESVNRIKNALRGLSSEEERSDRLQRELQLVTRQVIEEFVVDSSELAGPLRQRLLGSLPDQLRLPAGPKLLLFFDLNSAGPYERKIIAHGLRAFQQEYGRYGHRCVVTYRSTQQDDEAMQVLRGERGNHAFYLFDLRPVKKEQAVRYLRNVREYEAEIYDRLGWPDAIGEPMRRDKDPEKLREEALERIDQDCDKLRELISRHVVGGESLISTPLLMHWVSSLDSDQLEDVETLSDLYYHVVKRQLTRDLELYKDHIPSRLKRPVDGSALLRTAVTRVALVMHGRDETRISVEDFHAVLRDATSFQDEWWPENEFWTTGAYFATGKWSLTDDESHAIQEFSLFRREGDSLPFLHDSLIYYLVGSVALLCHERPNKRSRCDRKWCGEVVTRMSENPERWILPAEFLGGSVVIRPRRTPDTQTDTKPPADYTAVHRLAEQFILAEAHASIPTILSRLLRGAGGKDDTICGDLSRALGWHGSLVQRHPHLLAQESYNYLYWQDYWRVTPKKPCLRFAEGLLVKLREQARQQIERGMKPRSWLRQSYGPPPGSVQTMYDHTGWVLSVAVLDDGRIVSGSQFGIVAIWDPAGGDLKIMDDHTDWVTSVAAFEDGRIVSGSADGTVRLWDPAAGDVKTMEDHAGVVNAVAVLDDGRIVSGSSAGSVKLWDPAGGGVETVHQHTGSVWSVAVLGGGRIVSGSHDGTVNLWDPAGIDVKTVHQHTRSVWSVAVLDGGRIVSGSDDHTVKLWDPTTGEVKTMDEHAGPVSSLAVLADGRIVSGSDDRTIKLWDPTSGKVKTMEGHAEAVMSVAVLDDGRIVSGSADNKVRLWTPAGGKVKTVTRHTDRVTSLAILDGGRIVSGSRDGTVKLWDPATGELETTDDDRVLAVASLPDGRIVSGSKSGTVKVWDPASGEVKTMDDHTDWVYSVAVLPDGRIVSGSYDHTVKLWDPATDEVKTMDKHTEEVYSVAVLPDGRIVSGGRSGGFDHTVKLWDPATGEVKTMDEHARAVSASMVLSLAVLTDGRIVSIEEGGVKLWDPAGGEVKTMDVDKMYFFCVWWPIPVAVLDDGHIAFGGRLVTLWDPASGEVKTMDEHILGATSVATLEDGRIVSGGNDHTVKLWDPATGEVKTMDSHMDLVSAVAVLGDGRVVSGSYDGTVRLWDPVTDVTVPFIGRHVVECIVTLPRMPRIAAGLRGGQVCILDVEPDISIQRPSDKCP